MEPRLRPAPGGTRERRHLADVGREGASGPAAPTKALQRKRQRENLDTLGTQRLASKPYESGRGPLSKPRPFPSLQSLQGSGERENDHRRSICIESDRIRYVCVCVSLALRAVALRPLARPPTRVVRSRRLRSAAPQNSQNSRDELGCSRCLVGTVWVCVREVSRSSVRSSCPLDSSALQKALVRVTTSKFLSIPKTGGTVDIGAVAGNVLRWACPPLRPGTPPPPSASGGGLGRPRGVRPRPSTPSDVWQARWPSRPRRRSRVRSRWPRGSTGPAPAVGVGWGCGPP